MTACHFAPVVYPLGDYIIHLFKSETQIQAGCDVYEENNINYLSQLSFCLIYSHIVIVTSKRERIYSHRGRRL